VHGIDKEHADLGRYFQMLPARAVLFLLCLAVDAHAEQFTARIIAVLDGDTVMAVRDRTPPIKIRLAEIDAPEIAQSGGMKAKMALSEMVLHKSVTINGEAFDKYGRLVAQLSVDGKQVNEFMVGSGMAWEYSHFHQNRRYLMLQSEAQAARRGIWSQVSPLPPWQWRKLHADDKAGPSAHIRTPQRSGEPDYVCGSKRRCAQMASCDEAYFHFVHCNELSLDANHDGVPCERLCAGAAGSN
jgi:endonuclease YncB( thermonuclease family)